MMIKLVRGLTGKGLKESKEVMDEHYYNGHCTVQSNMSHAEAKLYMQRSVKDSSYDSDAPHIIGNHDVKGDETLEGSHVFTLPNTSYGQQLLGTMRAALNTKRYRLRVEYKGGDQNTAQVMGVKIHKRKGK